MFCIVFSGAVPLPNYQGLSTNDVQPEIQLGKKVEWKKECFQGLDHKYKNWEKKNTEGWYDQNKCVILNLVKYKKGPPCSN